MKAGDKFETHFAVSEAVYQGFLETFKDRHPLHTDSEYAQGLGFQGIVMHGNILNGFVSYFVGEKLPATDLMLITQEIQYLKPVFLNDSLVLKVSLTEWHESVKVYDFSFVFENQFQKKVAKGKFQVKKI